MPDEVPEPLINDIAEGRCLPFIGAGFSINAECDAGYAMPDWAGLTQRLRSIAKVAEPLDGPDAATLFERRFGRVNLIDEVRRSLNPGHVRPGKVHRAFAGLPFETIYTTNFDLLLEEALQLIGRPFRSLVGELQMPFHAGQFATNVVKMHGDIRHEEHFIITRADYDRFLVEYPVVATHLAAMLIVRTPLFVGYSRTDSDFLQIQEIISSRLGRFGRMPYIVQFDAHPDEIEQGFDQNIHILSVSTQHHGGSRTDALAKFFEVIQYELDVRAGKDLRRSEPAAFEEVAPEVLDRTYRSADATDLLESSSNLCFVMMPFAREFDVAYDEIIRPAAADAGLTSLRADQIYSAGVITEQIRAAIRESRVCIADVTNANPNVLYEIGLATSFGRPVIILTSDVSTVPFDLRHIRLVTYDLDAPADGRSSLSRSLQEALGKDKIDEAEALIKNGMYRAGVAMLGVIMEHTLRSSLYANDLHLARPGSLVRMADQLYRADRISADTLGDVRSFANIRNRAVHELEEPPRDDAEIAIRLLRRVLAALQT